MNVLFLCTGNSARSILAEAYLNHAGKGRFKAYSAGSKPNGKVNPLALELLRERGIEASARSKSWDEFAAPGAPRMDFVVTVCDNAAGEVCPLWPGAPRKAHWGVDDPAAANGSDEEKRAAFRRAFAELKQRIDAFLAELRRALAEGLGTALLLAAVVGSGIMGERLAQGNADGAALAVFADRRLT